MQGSVQDSAYFYLGKGYCKLMHVEENELWLGPKGTEIIRTWQGALTHF